MPDSRVAERALLAWLFAVQKAARTFAAAAWLIAGGTLAGTGDGLIVAGGVAGPGEVLAVAGGWVPGPADGVYWLVAAGLSAGVNRTVCPWELAAIPAPEAAPSRTRAASRVAGRRRGQGLARVPAGSAAQVRVRLAAGAAAGSQPEAWSAKR